MVVLYVLFNLSIDYIVLQRCRPKIVFEETNERVVLYQRNFRACLQF